MPDLTTFKDVGEALESFATVAALIVGGTWTYLTFVKQRLGLPRLEVTLASEEFALPGTRLLRVQVTLRNAGSVLAVSERAELRLRQVVPLPEDVASAALEGYDPVPEGCAHLEWPLLMLRSWSWGQGEFEIEPGESDSLCADFFVPESVQVVELYFYIANAKKPRQNIGWTRSLLYPLASEGAPVPDKKDIERAIREQQKQQRQQEPQSQQVPKQPQKPQTVVKKK